MRRLKEQNKDLHQLIIRINTKIQFKMRYLIKNNLAKKAKEVWQEEL